MTKLVRSFPNVTHVTYVAHSLVTVARSTHYTLFGDSNKFFLRKFILYSSLVGFAGRDKAGGGEKSGWGGDAHL